MLDVSVELQVAPHQLGTVTTHIIEISPKTFMSKLMQPLIRPGLG